MKSHYKAILLTRLYKHLIIAIARDIRLSQHVQSDAAVHKRRLSLATDLMRLRHHGRCKRIQLGLGRWRDWCRLGHTICGAQELLPTEVVIQDKFCDTHELEAVASDLQVVAANTDCVLVVAHTSRVVRGQAVQQLSHLSRCTSDTSYTGHRLLATGAAG